MSADVRDYNWSVMDEDYEIVGLFKSEEEADNYADYLRERDEKNFHVNEVYFNFDTSCNITW